MIKVIKECPECGCMESIENEFDGNVEMTKKSITSSIEVICINCGCVYESKIVLS